jgi:rSAM/selenodomain-associated transferase 2
MDNEKADISIIVPALNEAQYIENICQRIHKIGNYRELLVVDGGSHDKTRQFAAHYATVLLSPQGRAIQMNTGAHLAKGDILWFLHADCLPHLNSIAAISNAIVNSKIVGGAFSYNLDADGYIYRLAEGLSNYKNQVFNLFYGDMGIFIRKKIFDEMGGYHEIPLMEDIDLCLRLRKIGKTIILPQRIITSARRWKRDGALKNIFRNWILQLGWKLGISPHYLVKFYYNSKYHSKIDNEG